MLCCNRTKVFLIHGALTTLWFSAIVLYVVIAMKLQSTCLEFGVDWGATYFYGSKNHRNGVWDEEEQKKQCTKFQVVNAIKLIRNCSFFRLSKHYTHP